MARADHIQMQVGKPRWALHSLAAACASCVAMPVLADSYSPPPASPTDVRYTALNVIGSQSLYPRVGDESTAPQRLQGVSRDGPVYYASNVAVARIVVEVDKNAVPADGQSPVEITVRVFDRHGAPLLQPVFVTIEHSGGRVLLDGARTDEAGPRGRDLDRTTPGIQLKVENGVAQFKLLSPAEAQDVRVRVTAGDQEASGAISFVPEMREMIAAGLVEGIVNFRKKTLIDPVRRGDAFEQEIEAWSRQFANGKANVAARTAFYFKGTIRGDLLLTAAYDSDKSTRSRLLSDIRPDEFYPVYGDSSLRSFDARSGDRLYVRVDKQKSYVLYGDFVTGDGFSQPIGQGAVASLKQRSLGNYNRSATGLRMHHEEGRITGNAFVFNDTLRQVVEEFASQGSGPYGLRNNAVLEGSEKVEVVVRDRNQTSRIVSVRALARLVDYSFEPFSGRILLSTFLPSADENLNPVSLRVTYEVDQGGDRFWVAGGDLQVKLGAGVEVGAQGVTDRNPLAPYQLASANATWKLGERTAIVAEAARSTSTVNTNPANQTITPALAARSGEVVGQAWRVELAHEDERTEARAFVGRSSPEFNNPAAPLNGGRGEAQAKVGFKLTEYLKVIGEGLASEDRNPGGGKRAAAAGSVQWKATERLTLDVGLKTQRETVGTQGNGLLTSPFSLTGGLTGSIATGSGGGALGFGNQALDPTTGLPIITNSSLTGATSSLPAGTQLDTQTVRFGAGYKASDRLTVGGEVEHEVAGDPRRRAAVGADYQLAERTKLYGRLEQQSGWVQLGGVTDSGTRAQSAVAGVESTYLKDTQLFSEYRLRDALSGRDAQVASGARHFWDLAEGVRVNLGAEHQQALTPTSSSAEALTGGLDYTASSLWKGSTRMEYRRSGDVQATPDNERFDTGLFQAMVARKLDRDYTLLARNYLLVTRYAARGDVVQDRAQLGVAYRPVDTNRFNALAKLEYKYETDASNAAVGELKSRAWIFSSHADIHPSRPWWMTTRFAAKWQTDQFEQGTTSSFKGVLVSGRAIYDITENWDLGAMASVQLGQAGARQGAFGLEVGYLLKQNLWLSGGVNLTGFRGDADLLGYEYTQGGAYLRLRFKFDENLLHGANREVNRSLER